MYTAKERSSSPILPSGIAPFPLQAGSLKDYAVFLLDPNGNVATWNAGAARIKGYSGEEIIGQHFSRFYTPEDLASGKPERELTTARTLGAYQEEGPRVRKDGTIFHAAVTITALYDPAQKLIGFAKVTCDVSERKQAEDALLESQARLAGIVESAMDAIITVDSEQRILLFNRAAEKMFQYPSSDAIGLSLDRFLPERFRSTHGQQIRSFGATGVTTRAMGGARAVFGLRNNGEEFPIEASISQIDSSGGQKLFTVILRDITERRQAERQVHRMNEELEERVTERTIQLQAANKELEAFSYSVSHDLRAPLRGIDGFSQALLEDYADKLDEVGKGYLHEVRSASQEMGQLIEDVLQLARVSRSEMHHEVVDLSHLAERIVAGIQRRDPDRQVRVSIQPDLTAKGDERLLEILLTNLFENAWKFTSKRKDADIAFGREEKDGRAMFFVRDNGAGFDMKYVDKLFRAFQRLHTAGEFEGTGIGLATVQRIALRHGGTVAATGALNQGATIFFTLSESKEG